MRQRFRKGTTGSLIFQPNEGPPTSSATVTITDPGGASMDAVTVTLPTVATTLNTFEGFQPGSDFLTLLATTNIEPGKPYWLGTSGSSALERIQPRRLVTNAVWLTYPTVWAHENGEDFRGAELIAPLTATHTAEANQAYQAEWTYEVDGVTYRASQLFDVVLRDFKLPTTTMDLRRGISDSLLNSLKRVYTFDEMLQEAEVMVIDEIERDGRRADLVRDADQFRRLGVLAVRFMALRRIADVEGVQGFGEKSALDEARSDFDIEYGRISGAGLTWYDTDEDADVGLDEEQQQVAFYMQLG